MISKNSITPEWLATVSGKNNKADKILVEKVIRALLLLEGLARTDLKFVFKGGTALMLLMNSTKRLLVSNLSVEAKMIDQTIGNNVIILPKV